MGLHKLITDRKQLAKVIDHTNLSPTASADDIKKLCGEAAEYDFASVCVTPDKVAVAAKELEDSDVLVCTVVGFPLGTATVEVKAFEATRAVEAGAHEIDVVINHSFLGADDYDRDSLVLQEMAQVAGAVHDAGGKGVKYIFETGYHDRERILYATLAVGRVSKKFSGLQFFAKTSTGMALDKKLRLKDGIAHKGAYANDLVAMATVLDYSRPRTVGIKASGGIRNTMAAFCMLDAMGAKNAADLTPDKYRIGASAGLNIIGVKD